mmetsp:Transcript_27736/g.46594  ORF Transcript_27736/g.46594 Transcript_27736/m.46594 type:complete len:604 (+) Transcript_27736:220-2031(+)
MSRDILNSPAKKLKQEKATGTIGLNANQAAASPIPVATTGASATMGGPGTPLFDFSLIEANSPTAAAYLGGEPSTPLSIGENATASSSAAHPHHDVPNSIDWSPSVRDGSSVPEAFSIFPDTATPGSFARTSAALAARRGSTGLGGGRGVTAAAGRGAGGAVGNGTGSRGHNNDNNDNDNGPIGLRAPNAAANMECEEDHLPSVAPAAEQPPPTIHTALWGVEELVVVVKQVCLLCCDIVMLLIPLPLLLATRVRWQPVMRMLHKDDVFLSYTCELYAVVCQQLLLLLLDCLVLPFVLLVLLSGYRTKAVWYLLFPISSPTTSSSSSPSTHASSTPVTYGEEGTTTTTTTTTTTGGAGVTTRTTGASPIDTALMADSSSTPGAPALERIRQDVLLYHWVVLLNCATIFHDVLVLAPLVLLFPCGVACYRIPAVLRIICRQKTSTGTTTNSALNNHSNSSSNNNNNSNDIVHNGSVGLAEFVAVTAAVADATLSTTVTSAAHADTAVNTAANAAAVASLQSYRKELTSGVAANISSSAGGAGDAGGAMGGGVGLTLSHQWLKFDDEFVAQVADASVEKTVVSESAFLLFYQRKQLSNANASHYL